MPNFTFNEAVDDFLNQNRIAVAGISRTGESAANAVYKKLRDAGYEVFAVNPKAEEIEGDVCYPNLKAIPVTIDGVVVGTHPDVSLDIVRECAEVGIFRVWIHRSFGQGSYSEEAVQFCHENDIMVISGGCPLMFCAPVDFGHKCIRWILGATGGLPKTV